MTKFTPRRTTYRGIEMRSRTEGRYATYLDRHKVNWEYEPRAFADQNGDYLPDFKITDGFDTIYVDTKPTEAAAEQVLDKMRIIHSSEPTAHLRGAWMDQEVLKYAPETGHFWRFREIPGSRSGIDDWISWLEHHDLLDYERHDDDTLLLAAREADRSTYTLRVSVVVWPEPIDVLWADLVGREDDAEAPDHPALDRAAEIARSSGELTCLTHDRTISPRMIGVTADGQIADRYVGHAWATAFPMGII